MAKNSNLGSQLSERLKRYHDFRKTLPDYEEGIQKMSHLMLFDEKFPPPFPELTDFFYFKDSFVMLATVLFCQIFNSGYEEKGGHQVTQEHL